jgi:ABC-type branched-subunit amino acid transport system substrate-binding protein
MKNAITVIVMLATLGAGCGQKARPSIAIGVVLSRTGALSETGVQEIQAAQLAAEEINAAGGVLGSNLVLSIHDDATDKEKAKKAAQQLLDERVPAVIGTISSSGSLAMSELLAPAKVVQVATGSTSPLLSKIKDDDYFFRTTGHDGPQAEIISRRALSTEGHAAPFTRLAVIKIPGLYGTGVGDPLADAYVRRGGTLTSKIEYPVNGTKEQYTSMLNEIYQGNPQAIVLVGYPTDSATIIKAYNESFSAKETYWYFTDALYDKNFINSVGLDQFKFNHEGIGPNTPKTARYEAYAAAYKAKYGAVPPDGTYSSNAYDAVYLVALAMQAAGEPNGTKIRDNLRAISKGGKVYGPTEFKQAITAIKAGEDVNFEGAYGSQDFDENGDVPLNPFDVWRVDGNGFKIIASSVTD